MSDLTRYQPSSLDKPWVNPEPVILEAKPVGSDPAFTPARVAPELPVLDLKTAPIYVADYHKHVSETHYHLASPAKQPEPVYQRRETTYGQIDPLVTVLALVFGICTIALMVCAMSVMTKPTVVLPSTQRVYHDSF